MVDITSLEKLRPCGRLETYSTARHHLGIYKNVGLTATYMYKDEVLVDLEKHVFHALHQVIAKHPNLTAIPLDEDQSFPNVSFARLPQIDLRTCVIFRTRKTPLPKDGEADHEVDELLAEQHSRDLKNALGTAPFWRLIILDSQTEDKSFSATWLFHHALSDGSSAMLFHESFLAALNTPALDSHSGNIVKSPNINLAPPLEELHPMSMSWSFFLRVIGAALIPSIFARRPAKLWTGSPLPAKIEPSSRARFRTVVLTEEATKALAAVCRREQTSVTAALQCIFATSLFANLPASEFDKLKIDVPISLRPILQVADGQMINAISQYTYTHTRPSSNPRPTTSNTNSQHEFSWAEARDVKATIQAEVARKGHDNPIALLKYVSDMPAFLQQKLGKPREASVDMSNLGVWKGKEDADAKWHVGRMTFSQSLNVVSSPIGMNVVTGGDGKAVVNFCWSEEAVENELMEGVIGGFREGVSSVI